MGTHGQLFWNTTKTRMCLTATPSALDSRNCIVAARERAIVVLGAEDLVVIDSGDALLVCSRDRVQDVRCVVDELKSTGRDDLL